MSVVDMTYNGVIHFLTFSAKPAGDIELSLGKMFMSLVALVFGVSACYRTLKRGAVQGQRNSMITIFKQFNNNVHFLHQLQQLSGANFSLRGCVKSSSLLPLAASVCHREKYALQSTTNHCCKKISQALSFGMTSNRCQTHSSSTSRSCSRSLLASCPSGSTSSQSETSSPPSLFSSRSTLPPSSSSRCLESDTIMTAKLY